MNHPAAQLYWAPYARRQLALAAFGGVLAMLSAISPVQAQPALAPQGPMVVLTDTEEYCDWLQGRLRSCPAHPPEVTRLVKEGRLMCDHGDVRAGIARLRQAIMLQKHLRPCN